MEAQLKLNKGEPLVIKEQRIKDSLSGLTLAFQHGHTFTRLTIMSNFECGNRDFYFDRKGNYAGAGSGVGQCFKDGS